MSEKAATPSIKATSRELLGKKVKNIRTEGLVPGVVYGHKKDSISLAVSEKDFGLLFEDAGHSTLINLAIDDKKPVKVLIHEVQLHPVKKTLVHVDFYQVNLKEKIRTSLPLEVVGQADAIEIEGGTLMTIKDEVEVECLPDDLVQHIEVDITPLKTVEDVIHVSDLIVPAGITILDDAEEVLFSIAEPRSQEELEELDKPVTDGVAEVEVETKSGTDTAPVEERK